MLKHSVVLPILLAGLSVQASASNKINKLTIKAGIAYFETTRAKTSSLACVSPALQHQWSLDTTTIKGESQYLLLLSAIANSHSVKVVSANDCKLVPGLERALSLTLVQE
ncbi:hypothetical protein SG34_006360 [Thalassomonas viridans]|uniref:Uncharacterized protein n=1 Tax=Thalassomonas viridans TaxID=137584 RepID=A0AAF0C8K3_9GAMM|nr:hypothetical protein [Thalassomonas viridans]WDE06537.1 hypothetical protein SG34_006360 [Thalassomonas viridans]